MLDNYGLYKILKSENNNGYIDFNRVRFYNTAKNRNYYGYCYLIQLPLTMSQRVELEKYSNVELSTAQYKYAPELKYDTVIIMNNTINTVKGVRI